MPAEEVTIIDTVSYQGLTPGEEYELSAVLMDKEENAPWLVEDKVVMVSHRFIPEESSGTVDVEITIPGTNLDGVSLVVFESLLHDDIEVALHADIEDEGQTVVVDNPETLGTPYDKTGGDLLPVWVLISALILCGGAAGAYALRGRIRRNASVGEGSTDEGPEK